ncbi:MAG: flagellar hook-basal body protein [Planctomycetota bacterium]|jgi:flagellar basal-body rod protein FlgF|nr:flagellar hook-basal body protein [Planctomycetota bacterium]
MNYGLWMSAAGLSTEMHRQDVISNNLANAQTPGFKADYTFTRERPVAREELGTDTPSQLLLERLGGGVLAEPTWTNFQQGGLTRGGELDVAITGSGFFVVRDGDGDGFTRDGGFTRGGNGELVDSEGRPVLSTKNRPIRLPETGLIAIGGDGTVTVDGDEAGRIRVAAPDPSLLRKEGGNIFRYTGTGKVADASADVQVKQGWIENSGVDPIKSMTDLVASSRAVQASARFIDLHDRMMELAINRLGTVG